MAIPEPNNNYLNAFKIGNLTANKTFKDKVGGTDLYDFYKFNITQNSKVTFALSNLTDDAEIAIASDLNKDGVFTTNEIIDNTALSGSVNRSLISDLGTGTYYAIVSPGNSFFPDGTSNTNYTLKISPVAITGVVPKQDPGFTYQTSFKVGSLTAGQTYKQFVGGSDFGDFYKFDITKNSTLTTTLSGLSQDAEIAIISDLNKDGVFTTNEVIDNTALSGAVDRILISDLGTGTYYALISPGNSFFPDGTSNTNYTFKLTPKAITGVSPTKDPGFTYITAFKVGSLSATKTYKQFVGGSDLGDFYKFNITKNSTLTTTLTGLREDAEVAIISDLNKDGVFTTNEIIDNTALSGSVDRTLISDLGTGTYYALVSPGNSFFPDGASNTNYTLKLSPKAIVGVSPTKDPGFTYPTAFNIGPLSATKTYKQFVGGSDFGDFYKFSLSRNRTITLSLSGLRGDAEIAVVSDLNKDGVFTTSEIIDNTSLSGSVDRTLVSDLSQGTYYALVSPGNSFFPDGESNTNYTFKIRIGGVLSKTKKIEFTQKDAPNKQSEFPKTEPISSISMLHTGHKPLLEQSLPTMPQRIVQESTTQQSLMVDNSVLQALSPSCDVLTIGAALLSLGKHCLLH
ncbi:MAG: hypothetical protein WCD18_21405 [Thermosynechococcaceae cyanobacterium]